MAKLRLILLNKSGTPGNMVVYQRSDKDTLMPLAWLSQPTWPGAMVQMDWDDRDWAFVWAGVSHIQPGTVFLAAQVTPATPTEGNQIEFLAGPGGMYEFANQKNGAIPAPISSSVRCSGPSDRRRIPIASGYGAGRCAASARAM